MAFWTALYLIGGIASAEGILYFKDSRDEHMEVEAYVVMLAIWPLVWLTAVVKITGKW